MKILITGITGRIGTALAKTLLAHGYAIRGLVWSEDRQVERLAGLDIDLIEGSLNHEADVRRAVEGVDIICHLAAAFQAGGPFSNEAYFDINVRGTFNMLEAAKEVTPNLQQFFFASSDALYQKYIPGGMTEPIQEDKTKTAPTGLYAITKGLGEDLCLGYYRAFGLPLTVFRFALVVAGDEILRFPQFYHHHWLKSYQSKDRADGVAIRQQLEALKTDQEQLLIIRDGQGRSYKKHIADVEDIVLGFTAALGKAEALGQVFQLASPQPFTWAETIPYLAQKLDLPFADISLPDHVPTYYEFDLSKSQRLLHYQPQLDIFKMIDKALTMHS